METKPHKQSTESLVRDIRKKTKRMFTSEQKILIVMEGIRGESSVAEICRKHGIHRYVQVPPWLTKDKGFGDIGGCSLGRGSTLNVENDH